MKTFALLFIGAYLLCSAYLIHPFFGWAGVKPLLLYGGVAAIVLAVIRTLQQSR